MCHCNAHRPDNWYSRMFASLYDPTISGMEEKVLRERRCSLLAKASGQVLEVGVGTGVNLPLYPEAVQSVTGIDPSQAMLDRATSKGLPERVQLHCMGIGDTALQEMKPISGFDNIICTLVLCTVADPAAAVETIKGLLAPGGRLLLLEHIVAQQSTERFWQKLINPIWKRLAEGCHLTRNTPQLLRAKAFQPEYEDYFHAGLPFYEAIGSFS